MTDGYDIAPKVGVTQSSRELPDASDTNIYETTCGYTRARIF